MRKYYNLKCELLSPLHIRAGVSADKVRQTIKRGGVPYVPATLFKGCVRHQFERLLNALKMPLEISDEMFGKSGFDLSRVIFENMFPESGSEPVFEYRTNNKSDRYLRNAQDKHLVTSETVSPFVKSGEKLVFIGKMTVYYPENAIVQMEKILLSAVRNVSCIGSSNSRGWGFVSVSAEPCECEDRMVGERVSGRRKVTLTLDSDVIAGAVTIKDNFKESAPYFTGALIRAAFAKDILLDCPYKDVRSSGGKLNYIELKGEKCDSCEKKAVCASFSDMRFSFFYPEDCIPAPMTAKKCKTFGAEHPIRDTLVSRAEKCRCGECAQEGRGRLENLKGFVDPENKSCDVKMVTTTHTAIDRRTNSKLDGSLYSVSAVRSGQTFTGYIDDLGSGMLYDGKTIYAGKYSSNGFGKMTVTISECGSYDISERLDAFNRLAIEGKEDGKMYAAILFLSDAKLGFEKINGEALSNEDYEELWQNAVFGGSELFGIERIFAQNYIYRGYDTSAADDESRIKAPVLLTKMGSSLLISFDKNRRDEAVTKLCEMAENGVGEDTANGYGQIEICNRIHMIGGTDKND